MLSPAWTRTLRTDTIQRRLVHPDKRVSKVDVVMDDPSTALMGLRILVVDDVAAVSRMLSRGLRRAGAEVLTAHSAEAAFQLLPGFAPHLLISDINMPGEDGHSLLRRVRRLPSSDGGRVPAVALTGCPSDDDCREAMRSGFTAYLSKPVNPTELVAVASALARWER